MISEQEPQTPKTTLIRIGQTFNLLESGRTENKMNTSIGYNIETFHSVITLETSEISPKLPNIPLGIHFYVSRHPRVESITPFMPEEGYIIDERDFDHEAKKEKLKEMGYEHVSLKSPLYIYVEQVSGLLSHYLGLALEYGKKFEPETLSDLRRLQLQLFFPGEQGARRPSTYGAQLDEYALRVNALRFNEYLPLDLPLLSGHHGFSLYVPSDLERIQQIKARFFLKEEEQENDESSEFLGEDQS